MNAKSLAAIAVMGLMLATAFSGCMGGDKETSPNQEQGAEQTDEQQGANQTAAKHRKAMKQVDQTRHPNHRARSS